MSAFDSALQEASGSPDQSEGAWVDEKPEPKPCQCDDADCPHCGGDCDNVSEPVQYPFENRPQSGKWRPPTDVCSECETAKRQAERMYERHKGRFYSKLEKAGFSPHDLQQGRRNDVNLRDELQWIVDVPPTGNDIDDDLGLYIHGPTGAGKTIQAVCLMGAYLKRWVVGERKNPTAMYLNIATYIAEDRETWGQKDKSLDRTLADYLDADLLVVDDMGAEPDDSSAYSVIYRLTNERDGALKPTVYISNRRLPNTSRSAQNGPRLDEVGHYDARIIRRIKSVVGDRIYRLSKGWWQGGDQ